MELVQISVVTVLAGTILLALLQRIHLLFSHVSHGAKLPPGPKGLPLIGNLLEVPKTHSWLKFKEWGDQYGPLLRLNIMGWNHYVISNEKMADDLLVKRGKIYSSRGGLTAAAEIVCHGMAPVFLPDNDRWRCGRRLMHDVTTTSVLHKYAKIQSYEAARMVDSLIQHPADYQLWFERFSAAIIFRIGLGKPVETGNEPYVRSAIKGTHMIEHVASPGTYLVDIFPVLKHLPTWMAPFKQELQGFRDELDHHFMGLQNDVKEEIKDGTAVESWQRMFLENHDEYELSDEEGAWVLGSMFGAASGTTSATLMSFMLAMIYYPEWLRKVQDEVDAVTKSERLPEFDDMPNLPTVRAVVKETLRWRPVTAGGIPHMLVKDDVYNGFFIPAGTNVHANQWAIHRDPELYPDPENFVPARWLDPSYPTFRQPLTVFPNLQRFSAFGFGRRMCPGLNIAERSLYILVARIVWACDFGKKTDGSEAPPWYEYTSGLNSQPKPFGNCFDLKARSPGRALLVKQAIEDGRAETRIT